MSKKELTDIHQQDAINFNGVSKVFTQWQRDSKSIIKNLINPEKKVIAALDDVSFTVKKGEFTAYAGPNGAGKSTTMKLLAGMLRPTKGDIRVLGMSPGKDRVELMKSLGVLFGNRTELWWDHPVEQSFLWKKAVWNIDDSLYKRNLEMITELLELDGLLKTYARELSLGQRMRADLGMLLLHSPKIILLDEPTLGLDVVAKRQMIDFLKKINGEEGVTIMVTSHDMDDLEEMAQRILMISGGKIAYDGSFAGLRDISGSITGLVIVTDSENPPSLSDCTLVSASDGVFEYSADLSKTPIQKILGEISQLKDIKDVEIRKAPIEKVIAGLYKEWKEPQNLEIDEN